MRNFFVNVLIACSILTTSFAQQIKSSNYYSNNFEDAQIGTAFVKTSTDHSLTVSNSAALDGAYSLSSIGNNKHGEYNLGLLNENTNLSQTAFGWEWTFLYSTTNKNTDNNNNWKYWLTRESSSASSKGMYLTHDGNKLKLAYYSSPYYIPSWDVMSLKANTTYSIRVQRISNKWQVFVNEAGEAPNGAFTLETQTSYLPDGNNYFCSKLELESNSSGRFKFDAFKAYSMQLSISGANSTENGISSPIYPGQRDAIIYGLRIQTRGYFEISQFDIGLSGNVFNIIETGFNAGKMYRSKDSFYGNSDDIFLSDVNIYSTSIQKYIISMPFYSIGDDSGAMVDVEHIYITANIRTTAPANQTFEFTGANNLTNGANYENYASNTDAVVNTQAPPSQSGNVKDWIGTTDAWNVASNWSPSGVPSAKDLVKIGVVTFNKQPIISVDAEVGNIILGTKKEVALAVNNSANLMVKGNVEAEGSFSVNGTGTVDVKGRLLTTNDKSATITVSNQGMILGNLMLDSEEDKVIFNANSTSLTVRNILSLKGKKANTFILGANSTLVLNGSQPFDVVVGAVLNLSAGTVIYESTKKQQVYATPYKNITLQGSGVKEMPSGVISVSGNWNAKVGKVDFAKNQTNIVFNGSNQSISEENTDGGKGIIFGNLNLSGGGTKTFEATGKFALAENKYFTLSENTAGQLNNNFTFKASNLGTAALATVPASSSIRGKATVEVYIRGGSKTMWRTNRMLSSPVYDNTDSFINSDVQGNRTYSFTQFIDDMIITGNGGSSKGFDDNAGSAASAWIYNAGFKAIPQIDTKLNIGAGAYLYYRGNRDNFESKVSAPFVDPEAISMTFKGTLNQQNVTVPIAKTTLLGNPYAATIDWKNVTKSSNIGQVLKVWNPGKRQYSVYNGIDGVNGGSRYIAPGQSFFIQTTDNNPGSVTFRESDKVGSQSVSLPTYDKLMSVTEAKLTSYIDGANTTFNSSEKEPARIRVQLDKNNTENSDETLIVLNDNQSAVATEIDVPRGGGEEVFMSSLSAEGKQMAINYMPPVADLKSIKLGVNVTSTGSYSMSFKLSDFPAGFEAKLRDKFQQITMALDNQNLVYAFDVDKAVSASFGNDRFEILLAPISTLPINLVNFTAQKQETAVRLSWKSAAESNNSHFEIQRSSTKAGFTSIAAVDANSNGVYAVLDNQPFVGMNYYKLVQIDKDGTRNPFEPVSVNFSLQDSPQLTVYPTVVDESFTIQSNTVVRSENYTLRLSDVFGKLMTTKNLTGSDLQGGYLQNVSTLSSGLYFVEIRSAKTNDVIGLSKWMKK